MSTLIVTFDLNHEIRRPNILNEIKKGGDWAKLSESSYAIKTYETPQQVYNRLSKFIDDNDNCYVVTLNAPYSGRGPQAVNTWLTNNLQHQHA